MLFNNSQLFCSRYYFYSGYLQVVSIILYRVCPLITMDLTSRNIIPIYILLFVHILHRYNVLNILFALIELFWQREATIKLI